ncbi:hypothetical protein CLU79DRAFT_830786 [Phycomyces nitens]|nr:hypothetical protein CLU79DRAFT_830786 [Phycomyces nitens]
MNTRIPPPPRQRNPRLNAVARSALAGGMNTTLITEPESTGTMISGNQDNMNKLDSIHKLLLSTNEKVDSLTAEIETISKNMGVMENGICLSNETNAYLKNKVDEIVLAQAEVKGVMEKENFSAGAGLGIDLSSLTEKAFVSAVNESTFSFVDNNSLWIESNLFMLSWLPEIMVPVDSGSVIRVVFIPPANALRQQH